MSVWTKLRDKVLRPAIGATFGGPLGAVIAGSGAVKSVNAMPSGVTPHSSWENLPSAVAPRMSGGNQLVMASVPAIGRVGAGALARVAGPLGGALSAASVARSAASYCRRHPAWCSTIGLVGVSELITSGSLPPIKRRRSRGITGTELKNFRRVSGVLNKWCKVPAPTQRARRKV